MNLASTCQRSRVEELDFGQGLGWLYGIDVRVRARLYRDYIGI